MKRSENGRPITRLLKLVKRVFEVSQKAANAFVECPEKNRRGHIGNTKQPQYDCVHGAELNRRRSRQQNAENNQVMVEARNALLGDHVKVSPRAVVLFKYGHLFLHNVKSTHGARKESL